MEEPIFLALAVAIGVVIFFYGLRRTLLSDVDVADRLGQYETLEARAGREGRASPLTDRFDRAIEKTTFAETLARDLARADLKFTVTEFLFIQVAIGSVLFVGSFLLGAPIPVPMVLPLIAVVAPRWFLGWRQAERLKAFNDQLGDTLTMIANALRSGYSLLQSMDVVARDAADPTKTEFQRVVREVSLGLSSQEALLNLVRRINSDDMDLVVTAIAVQHEVGGNLAQILDTIGHTIRERIRIKGEIKVLTAQQQLSGYVISLMPIGLMGFLFVVNPGYISMLFTPGITLVMPICAGIGIIAGFLIMKKITDIEV